MTELMASGTFRLKSRELFHELKKQGKIRSKYQVSKNSGITYPTVDRWVKGEDIPESVNYESLAGFLVDGLGITPDELAQMQFGEIFEFIPKGNGAA